MSATNSSIECPWIPDRLVFELPLPPSRRHEDELCRQPSRSACVPSGACGLPKGYTIHRHRDTFAVTMARRGMPLPTLQRILGHKTIQQTMKYAAFQPDYADVDRYIHPERSPVVICSGTKSGTAAAGVE